jgi:2-polyprenyl-6-methoxyphenol hydroxylase-like FAD-dependent oxidoreductase
VIVVGAGVAGTAAAIAAAAEGMRTTIVDGGTGASTLSTGAIDFVPWTQTAGPAASISQHERVVLDALGGYALADRAALLLTSAGIVRSARGHDIALLDVANCANGQVGVVRCDRPGWDADALARAWGSLYDPIDATVMRHTGAFSRMPTSPLATTTRIVSAGSPIAFARRWLAAGARSLR